MTQNDVFNCPICLNPISNEGKHRISVLKGCGHIFCLSCITESLKYKNECPICRKKAKEKDILPLIWDCTLPISQETFEKYYDNNDEYCETLKKLYLKEEECNLLKKKLDQVAVSEIPLKNLSIIFEKEINHGGRISISNDILLITEKVSNSYGTCLIRISDFKEIGFISLHSMEIKDIKFSNISNEIITVSLDKSFVLSNLTNKTVLFRYYFNEPLFSCEYINNSTIAIGGNHGKLYILDINTHTHKTFQCSNGPPVSSLSKLNNSYLLVCTSLSTKIFDIVNSKFKERTYQGSHFVCKDEINHICMTVSRIPPKSSVVKFYNYNDEGKLIEIKSKNMEYYINLGRPSIASIGNVVFSAIPKEKKNCLELFCIDNLNFDIFQFLKCSFIHPDHPSPILDIILKDGIDDNMFLFTLSSSLLRVFFIPEITEKIC